jgi:proteasome lid subunit RPN8/RPN11
MAAQPDRATVTWSTPECPFSIECSSRVLDDIRLAVTDAFFSLPRGGAEIGGILLGAWQEGRLTISGYAALDCEHALGPSFTLSLGDETKLQELIRAASASGAGWVVGWYHSHTRTGVLLSDSDLTIHNRFFPEPWQVALVVKPHTFEPMRAGFFFRGHGGIIHSSASYREFPIEPVPMQQVPRAVPMEPPPAQPPYRPASAGTIVDVRAEPETPAAPAAPIVTVQAEREVPQAPAPPIVDIRAEPAAQPAPAATAAPQASVPEAAPPAKPAATAQSPLPSMLDHGQERSWRWLKALLAVGLVLAAGVALYTERDAWYPSAAALLHRAPSEMNAASIGLNTVDQAGQLQIRWDPNSTSIRAAAGASLEIADGDPPSNVIPLDTQHLASGVFTYGRRNARVDVTLVLDQPGGAKVRQVTSFLGQKPPAPSTGANPAQPGAAQPNHDREETARLIAGLRAQLNAELERNRTLEKQLATARAQLREQQLRRLGNQARPLEH